MNRFRPSANSVSKASDDFPLPDTPVTTVSAVGGNLDVDVLQVVRRDAGEGESGAVGVDGHRVTAVGRVTGLVEESDADGRVGSRLARRSAAPVSEASQRATSSGVPDGDDPAAAPAAARPEVDDAVGRCG